MDAEKIRNLTADELQQQQRDLNDQLFRLKFQLKMGQTESLKKIRGLRRDVARVMTIMREKQLTAAGHNLGHRSVKAAPVAGPSVAEAQPAAGEPASKPTGTKKAAAKKAVVKKAVAKKAAGPKAAAKTRKK
ncbi:MAG TPA: 50S ribosomal protein L29 [Candidatus Saccharimonadales bacterium]|jgi:large subunit ribosomal protein L29|nr:50S ribosomal protein L29 [Candidatus Saccharimonadales bacterium]